MVGFTQQHSSTLGKTNAATSIGSSFGTLPTAGNMVVAYVQQGKSAAAITSQGTVTDNQGNTYTNAVYKAAAQNSSDGGAVGIWYCLVIGATSGTFTVTFTTGSSQSTAIAVQAVEYLVAGGTAAIDKTNSNSSNQGGAPSSTGSTGVLSTTTDLACTTIVTDSGSSLTVPTSYTSRENSTLTTLGWKIGAADLQLAASTAINPAWTTMSAGSSWVAAVATFKVVTSTTFNSTLAVSVTATVGMSAVKHAASTLSVASTVTPRITLSTTKTLSVASIVTVAMSSPKTIAKALSVAVIGTPSMLNAKQKASSLSVAVATSLTMLTPKAAARTLSVAVTASPSMVRSISKTISVAVTATPSMVRSVGKKISIAVAATPTMTASATKHVTMSVAASVTVALSAVQVAIVFLKNEIASSINLPHYFSREGLPSLSSAINLRALASHISVPSFVSQAFRPTFTSKRKK